MKFDANAYWAGKDKKVYVVRLERSYRENGKKREATDIKYVRASTPERAAKTAKHFSTLRGRVRAYVRYATPTDLGCVPAGEAA